MTANTITWMEYITRKIAQNNLDNIVLFIDRIDQQASELRGEINTIGIPILYTARPVNDISKLLVRPWSHVLNGGKLIVPTDLLKQAEKADIPATAIRYLGIQLGAMDVL